VFPWKKEKEKSFMYMEIDVPVGTSEVHKNPQENPFMQEIPLPPNIILLSLSP
jgi:hypothetical protein